MTLEPILDAPRLVQAHVVTVLLALVVGTWVLFFSRKGAPLHRFFGASVLALMVSTAVIALFIHRRIPLSPAIGFSSTHLIAVFVLFAVWRALDGALKGNIRQHRTWVSGLYFGGLIINGMANVFFVHGITRDVFALR
jgi:uncharacterized membrane protein